VAGSVDRGVDASRRLAVFDIDGTLTDSHDLDSACYRQALSEVFGFSTVAGEYQWSDFPDVTDSAILGTLVERHRGRDVDRDELERFEGAFVERIAAALRDEPGACRPVTGAVEFLERLAASRGWRVALATGGFRRSALLKLMHAGFDPPEILASSEDAPRRVGIVGRAVALATALEGSGFLSIVTLGDGVWDVLTAEELRVPCVGIGRGERAGSLSDAGAFTVLADYSDGQRALEVLEAAAAHPTLATSS